MRLSKTLILHIGAEKTGSKSIQRSLGRSAAHLLRRYNILFPQRRPLFLKNAHYPIVSPFMKADELDFVPVANRLNKIQLHAALAALRQPASADTIVLSAEHISARLGQDAIVDLVTTMRSALPDHRLKVVYHVRSQSTQFCAAMSTHLKSFGIQTKPIDGVACADRYLNHLQVASEWANVVGKDNIVIKSHHAADALSLFYGALGVDMTDPGIRRPRRRNTSLSREQASILLAVNTAFGVPDFKDEALIRTRRHVQRSLVFHLDSALATRTPMHSILSAADVAVFRTAFAESNDRLKQAFDLDFNLNDFMEVGDVENHNLPWEGNAAFRKEFDYWQGVVDRGPPPALDPRKAARRLRALLARKHLRRLLLTGWRGRAA